ncbi:hypothetical protein Nepgr_027829 [Nepenthes gracilis]|uniref:NADP-dependent oxidoreductase domain-containing protein n=1 Tax=Nepenthes gracilis TaxID=150966 RepID=A0AAD3TC28_NEPGR|nr:hypothetical protein Nepgr_027829 [Nepenthes gracilis]
MSDDGLEQTLHELNNFASYRHIDYAPIYGIEKELGVVLMDLIREGVVKRKDLMKQDSVTLEPEYFLPADIPITWKTMEAVYNSGKAKATGVSNFSMKKLEDLFTAARIPPAVTQVECHPS